MTTLPSYIRDQLLGFLLKSTEELNSEFPSSQLVALVFADGELLGGCLSLTGGVLETPSKRKSDLEEEEFTRFHSSLKGGDIFGIVGFPSKSKRGELSTFPKNFIVLSHCLHMMPRQKIGPGDNAKETRYRQRYLDLMLNSEVREIFRTRSKVISHIRQFLDERDFLEVETHMMHMIAGGGGAVARPFVIHHNDLNMRLYTRSVPELYLNELVVGDLELY